MSRKGRTSWLVYAVAAALVAGGALLSAGYVPAGFGWAMILAGLTLGSTRFQDTLSATQTRHPPASKPRAGRPTA